MQRSPLPLAGRLRRILPAAALALAVVSALGCRSTLPGAAPSPMSRNPFVATKYHDPATKISKLLVIAPSTGRFESKGDLSTGQAARLAEINTFTDGFVKALPAAVTARLLAAPVTGKVLAVPVAVANVKVNAPEFPFQLKIDLYSTQYGLAGARLNVEVVLREAGSDRIVWKAIAEVLVDPAAGPDAAAVALGDRIRTRLAQDGLL
jgi:hypothetical protein